MIEEFVNPSDQIIAVFSFIGDIMENLETEKYEMLTAAALLTQTLTKCRAVHMLHGTVYASLTTPQSQDA